MNTMKICLLILGMLFCTALLVAAAAEPEEIEVPAAILHFYEGLTPGPMPKLCP